MLLYMLLFFSLLIFASFTFQIWVGLTNSIQLLKREEERLAIWYTLSDTMEGDVLGKNIGQIFLNVLQSTTVFWLGSIWVRWLCMCEKKAGERCYSGINGFGPVTWVAWISKIEDRSHHTVCLQLEVMSFIIKMWPNECSASAYHISYFSFWEDQAKECTGA